MDLARRIVSHIRAERPAVAYSGGVDSTVLLHMLTDAYDDAAGVFVDTPFLSQRLRDTALGNADALGLRLIVRRIGWEGLRHAADNDEMRCWHCKRAIYREVTCAAGNMGADIVLDGENADDPSDRRSGRMAAREFGIRSPFSELGIGRGEIEDAFSRLDVPNAVVKDTCMATRIPSGTVLTDRLLREVESLEAAVRGTAGVEQVRVRLDGRDAVVLTSPSETRMLIGKAAELAETFGMRGYTVRVDEDGYKG